MFNIFKLTKIKGSEKVLFLNHTRHISSAHSVAGGYNKRDNVDTEDSSDHSES